MYTVDGGIEEKGEGSRVHSMSTVLFFFFFRLDSAQKMIDAQKCTEAMKERGGR